MEATARQSPPLFLLIRKPVTDQTLAWWMNYKTSITKQRFQDHYQLQQVENFLDLRPLTTFRTFVDKFNRHHIFVTNDEYSMQLILAWARPCCEYLEDEDFVLDLYRFDVNRTSVVVYGNFQEKRRLSPVA